MSSARNFQQTATEFPHGDPAGSNAEVYPPVADEINGLKDSDFDPEIPPGTFRILALGASAFVTRDFQPRIEALLNENPLFVEPGLKVRVVSAGVPAQMTYDSLWKYAPPAKRRSLWVPVPRAWVPRVREAGPPQACVADSEM